MSDVLELLRRQARWQKSRQALSWPEKIRLAQQIRDSIRTLRGACEAQKPLLQVAVPEPDSLPRAIVATQILGD